MNNNNAPFYVGQRVVFIKDDFDGGRYNIKSKLETGSVHRIVNIWYSKGTWDVTIGDGLCYNYSCFAPIDERTVSIPESLKEQAEEMIKVREVIEEPVKERV